MQHTDVPRCLFKCAQSTMNLVRCHQARLKYGRSVQGLRVPASLGVDYGAYWVQDQGDNFDPKNLLNQMVIGLGSTSTNCAKTATLLYLSCLICHELHALVPQ
jgi:hypothetical protein